MRPVTVMLDELNARLGREATEVGPISGTEADLLAWLMGRSDGAGLDREYPGSLPQMPSLYLT